MRRLVVMVVLAAAACSSPLPLAEYRASVQDLGRSYEAEVTELQASLHDRLQTEIRAMELDVDVEDPDAVATFADEALALTTLRTRTFFAAVADALDRYRTALGELEPPVAVADVHEGFLQAMDAVLAGLPELLAGLESAASFDDIDAAVNGSGYGDAQPRFRAACETLEDALRATGAGANLRCPS